MRMKRLAAVLCAAQLALRILSGCGSDSAHLYENGMTALEQGSYAEAAEFFTEGIQARSRLAENWRGLGIAWYEQGKYEQAEEAFSFALSSMDSANESFSRDVMLFRARNLASMDRAVDADTVYDQLLENNPEDPEIYFLKGKNSLEQGNFEEAAADFHQAVDYSATYSMSLSVYQLYQAKSLKADGDVYLEKALAYTPSSEEDYYLKGLVCYYLQMPREAAEALQKAVNSGNNNALGLLGNMYLELGEKDNARQIYQESMKQEGFEAISCNGLAICEIEDGNYEAALEYIRQGLTTAEGESRENLLFNEAVVYEKTGDFSTARDKMQQLLQEFPDCAEAQREQLFLNH